MDRRALAVVAAAAGAIRAAASAETIRIRVTSPEAAPTESLTIGVRIPPAAFAEAKTLAFLAAAFAAVAALRLPAVAIVAAAALAIVAAAGVAIRAAASRESLTIELHIPAAAFAETLAFLAETLAFLAAVVALTVQAVGFHAVLSSIEKICRWIRYSPHLLGLNVGNRPEAVRRNSDVFLNFCGQDIQDGLADYLSIELDAQFSAFKDDCDQIGPELSRAIEKSKVAICIISKNCGGSNRFLTTLSQIMRRHAEQRLLVLPIFYEVDVSHVRDQTGEFGQAFSELADLRPPEQIMEEWKRALRSLARIMGWSSRDFANGRRGLLVKMVVKKVSSTLSPPWIERIPMFRNRRRACDCQVFLISSPATTKNFTCHLHYSLVEKISVFSDDDQYFIGKDFAHEVRNALDPCKIFIVVISEDFASSRDCLDKLAQIVECFATNGTQILPIFLGVDALQNQEVWDHIQNDMMQHDVPQDTRQQWEDSLRCVCSIGGLASENFSNWKQLMQSVYFEIRSMQTGK